MSDTQQKSEKFQPLSAPKGVPDAEQWAHLAVTGIIWLVLPLVVGLRLVLRSEVK